jgi:predicted DNA-binding transcriptional regulator AlpA
VESESLISQRNAAAFLNLSVRTMEGMRSRGVGPKFVRLSARCVRYRWSDVQAWLETREVSPQPSDEMNCERRTKPPGQRYEERAQRTVRTI